MFLVIFFSDINSLKRCLTTCLETQRLKTIVFINDRYIVVSFRKNDISIFLIAEKESEKTDEKIISNIEESTNYKYRIPTIEIKDELSIFNELNKVKEFEIVHERSFIALMLNFSIIPCILKKNNRIYAIILLDGQPLLISKEGIITGNYLLVSSLDLAIEEINEFPNGKMINYKLFGVCSFKTVGWKGR